MTRRKGEITASMNERDFPHVVELPLPEGGFGGQRLAVMEEFHRLRGIESRRGRRQRRNEQEFVRWCFAERADAAASAWLFGGTLMPAGSWDRSRGSPR